MMSDKPEAFDKLEITIVVGGGIVESGDFYISDLKQRVLKLTKNYRIVMRISIFDRPLLGSFAGRMGAQNWFLNIMGFRKLHRP